MKKLAIIAIAIIMVACNSNGNYDVKLQNPNNNILSINRYDIDIMNVDTADFANGLVKLADKYEIFLGTNLSANNAGIQNIKSFVTDTFVKQVADDCKKVFPENHSFSKLNKAFNHLHHYYPNFSIPEVYTYISGFDYEYPVIYNDDNLIIALDMYLGNDYDFYKNLSIPIYIIRRYDKSYLERDCMMQIADMMNIDESSCNKLIDWMIYYGKNIEFTKMMIPSIQDTCLLGYTKEQLQWCEENEENIWNYLISGDLLFTTDIMMIRKFIDDGPFTSLFARESPASLGRWLGWKIVAYYRVNNDVSISELMQETESQKILNKSGYRPK